MPSSRISSHDRDASLPSPSAKASARSIERLVLEDGQPSWPAAQGPDRSEEHTSELQSLMRISYAVFCLKKKNRTKKQPKKHTQDEIKSSPIASRVQE